jgi:hypothetical protein
LACAEEQAVRVTNVAKGINHRNARRPLHPAVAVAGAARVLRFLTPPNLQAGTKPAINRIVIHAAEPVKG